MEILVFVGLVVGLIVLGNCFASNSEKKQLETLAREHNLTLEGRGLRGGGLELDIVTEGSGKSRADYVVFRQSLSGFPEHLKIIREGAESGAAYAQGEREVITGDVDFDDYFWLKSNQPRACLDYLNGARRLLILEAMVALPGCRIEEGALQGKLPKQGNILKNAVKQAVVLARLATPAAVPFSQGRPPGWVNRDQRRYHAHWGLLLAALLGTPPAALLYVWCYVDATRTAWSGLLPLGLAIVLGLSSLALWLGHPGSTRAMRACLRLGQWGAVLGPLACMLLGLLQFDFGTLLFSGLVGAVGWFGLEAWRNSLLRVRVTPPERAPYYPPEAETTVAAAPAVEAQVLDCWTTEG